MAYDIVGWDIAGDMEVVGQDAELAQLLAAAGQNAGLAPSQMKSIAADLVSKGALLVRQQGFTKAREYPLGFVTPAAVGPGLSSSATTRPQVIFRSERLVIPSDIGGSFVIDDLIVGKNSQFAATDTAVPARVFDERAVGVRLKGDTAQVSQNVQIAMTNISGAAITFRACVIGSVVE